MNDPAARILSALLVILIARPGTGYAQEAKPSVIVSPLEGAPNPKARAAIASELKASKRVNVIDLSLVDRYLEDRSGAGAVAAPSGQDKKQNEAASLLTRGQEAYQKLRMKEAVELLEKAKLAYRNHLSEDVAFDGLRAAQFHLAMAYVANGAKGLAREELKEVVRLDPQRATRVLTPKLYSPEIRKLFEEVQKEVTRGVVGDLTVSTQPEGATVYLDGKSLGAAPVRAPKVPAGEHFLRVTAGDFEPSFSSTYVVAGENRVDIVLRGKTRKSISGYFTIVENSNAIDHARAAFLDEMGLALTGDIFVFLSPSTGAVKAQFYDQRSQEVSPVEGDTSPAGLVEKLLSYLDSSGYVSPHGGKTPEAQAPPPELPSADLPPELVPQTSGNLSEQIQKPLTTANRPGDTRYWYENPWVWMGIAGGLAVAGGGLLLLTDIGKSEATTSTLTFTIPGGP